MLHGSEIDVARRLAAGALDLQPRKTAVDRLVNGRRRIDRLAIRPHALVPGFAEQLVGLTDEGFAFGAGFGGLPREDRRHRA
jgi:hypothetical protein